jgi:glycosyltransferase involved in cell wall biosynthesis
VKQACLIASHPTGNANVRNAIQAFADAGILQSFETTIAVFPDSFLGRLASLPGFGELKRRGFPRQLARFTHTHPWLEILRLGGARLGIKSLVRDWHGVACIDNVFRSLDKATAWSIRERGAAGVYCYEDGALETFRAAKQASAVCFYDLPIGYWRAAHRILSEEAERRPEWAATMPGLSDPPEKLERKDEELRLADKVLVASSFTKHTLAECPFPVGETIVIPYGADEETAGLAESPRESAGRLRVLFVGGLSQRKGIADLFEAVAKLGGHVELTVIGKKAGGDCPALDTNLSRHRWIPSLPREGILAEMRNHDVLVFPSLFEGFGLVVTEALSQGLPVITTPHTCGPDILEDGVDGFIVPIRNPEAIAEKLEHLASDRSHLAEMSQAALKKARSLSWVEYRRRIVEVVFGSIKCQL